LVSKRQLLFLLTAKSCFDSCRSRWYSFEEVNMIFGRMKQTLFTSTIFICMLSFNTAEKPSEIYKRQEKDSWFKDGTQFISDSLKLKQINKKAKNVILFLGDGMGVSTVTAARILQGQLHGKTGEEGFLSWERFPYVALSKTYNTDQQTADSAGTATAFMTGVKAKAGVISVDDNADYAVCGTANGTSVLSILEMAELNGLSTGVVTTARLTHATPAVTYAHSVSRRWENDADLPSTKCKDIASQLIDFPYGDGIEVAMGGGRRNFMTQSARDPETGAKGRRRDGRDLISEWTRKTKGKWTYVWNDTQFQQLDVNNVDHVLGLFNPSHMEYSPDRLKDIGGEPSLTNMTEFAIKMLSKNDKGFFLLVEAGRIDHGHHASNAFTALHDAVEMANAVSKALEMTKEEETLIVVTADHSHTFVMGGYPLRGNPILGLVDENDRVPASSDTLDKMSYTTLGYLNGPGAKVNASRDNPARSDVKSRKYKQQSIVPRDSETHGGEDVGIYARGPFAHLLHGVMEQNVIFHIMDYSLCLSENKKKICAQQNPNPNPNPNSASSFSSSLYIFTFMYLFFVFFKDLW